jgi:hypothetical protein
VRTATGTECDTSSYVAVSASVVDAELSGLDDDLAV